MNRIDDLREKLKREAIYILENEFANFDGDPTTAIDQIVKSFDKVIEQIRYFNNKKSQTVQSLTNTNLLIPKHQTKYIWAEEIKGLKLNGVQVITEADITSLPSGDRITVLDLGDYKLFELLMYQPHSCEWLLYADECKRFENYQSKFEKNLIDEFESSDRKWLTGVDFPTELESPEPPDEVIERIFGEPISEILDINRSEWSDSINKKIIYTDANEDILHAGKSVLVYDGEGFKKCKVGDLISGDWIRFYQNQHEDLLFQIAEKADDNSVLNQIEKYSRDWKRSLTKYLDAEIPDDNPLLSLLDIDSRMIRRRIQLLNKADQQHELFGVKNSTVLKWEEPDSAKFPQNDEVLKFLLKGNPVRCNEAINSKRKYNSIMIALGRDLSEEITEYVLTGEKGPILKDFDEEIVKTITEQNMPSQEIRSIETVQDEENG